MIHVIVGPPCAGKTTWVVEQMKPGDVRLDFDALNHAVGGPDAPRHSKGILAKVAFACWSSVYRNVTGAVWRHDSAGADAWMIHSRLKAEQLADYEAAGAKFHLIDPGEDTCLERADQRDGDEAEAIKAAIRQWYANPPDLPEGTHTMKSKEPQLRYAAFKARLLDTPPEGDDGEPLGRFDALVSVFNVEDAYGAVILPGAFKAALEARGDHLPILWSHKWDDIWSHIGEATAEETDDGLVVHAQLDLDVPTGAQAFRLLQKGRIREFSIGGFVPADGFDIKKDENGRLTEYDSIFDLREVSLCLVGANPDTQLLDVKAASADRGVSLDRLKALRADLDDLIAEEETPPGTDPTPTPPPPIGEDTKATEHQLGGLPNSGSVNAALLNAVVETVGPKE